MSGAGAWAVRPEGPGEAAAVFAVHAAAFPSEAEARLVEALRRDAEAWIPELSTVALDDAGRVVGHALLTRCTVGGGPALALAPCAVLPALQRLGAGSAAIRAGLEAARARAADGGENLVVVLGHPGYYPRFGFTPAADWGITAPFDAPSESFQSLALDPRRPTPRGEIAYPAAFGL